MSRRALLSAALLCLLLAVAVLPRLTQFGSGALAHVGGPFLDGVGEEEEDGDADETEPRKQARYDHPEGFVAYHAAIRRPDGVAGAEYAPGYEARALDAAVRVAKGGAALPWQEHGPSNVAGRARAFVVDRRDATGATWYTGTAGGGIWKTTNSGAAWANVSGTMPNLAVSALAQAPSAPATFYAGTGEGFSNVDAIAGSGIFKTTDGGATWTLLPSTATGTLRTVNRIVVSPTDANVAVAATTGALARTTDGGQTWTTLRTGRFDQVVASADFSALYAASRGSCSSTAPLVLRSTDGGATWTTAAMGFAAGERTELAIDPANAQRLVASVDGCDALSHLYLTTNGGTGWTRVAGSTSSNAWLGGQGWYDNTVAISPLNPNLVYAAGIDAWRLTLSGTAASPVFAAARISQWNANTSSSSYVHADHHSLTFFPAGAVTRFVSTNDGGVFSSDDAGTTWTARNGSGASGLNTTQFYGVDKSPTAVRFLAGAQDNGTWESPTSPAASSVWSRRAGGDGFDAAYNTASEYLLSLYYNTLYRLEGSSFVAVSGLDVGSGNGPFITTIGTTMADRARLVVPGTSGPWRSDDFGRTWSLGTLPAGSRWGFNGSRTVVAVSVADARVVWTGTRMSANGSLFVSRDGGATYATATTPSGLGALVTGLATHPTEPGTAYALFSVAAGTKVLKTTDYGATWTVLSGTFTTGQPLSSNGFPDVAVYSLLVMPTNPNVLWAGTEIGLFVSENGGATWTKDTSGLPPVSLWQMKIADGRVVVATHGRGIWSVALPELAAYTPPPTVRSPNLRALSANPAGGVAYEALTRDALDSVVVLVNGVRAERRGPTAADVSIAGTLSSSVTQPTSVTLQVVGYKGGQAYSSGARSATAMPMREAVASYTHTFDDGAANAANLVLDGFQINTPAGFLSPLVHSASHPYPVSVTHTMTLTQPIRVTPASTLTYRDVALVEPGEAGSTWPSEDFYDYVVVEATKNGADWVALAPGYDARYDAAWLAAYTGGTAGLAALLRTHTISLNDRFAAGDVVTIRFRLYSDFSDVGWGWGIDDVAVTGTATAADGDVRTAGLTLGGPAPNPVRTRATLALTLPTAGRVRIDVVDLTGRRVATLADEVRAAGASSVVFDASGLGSGVYLVRLTAQGQTRTRAVSVVR